MKPRFFLPLFFLASSVLAQPGHGPISGGSGGSSGPATALQSPVVIEGTADAFEGNFTFADPTADWTLAFGPTGTPQFKDNVTVGSGGGYFDLNLNSGIQFPATSIMSFYAGAFDEVAAVRKVGAGDFRFALDEGTKLAWIASGTSATGTIDTELERAAAGIVKVTSAFNLPALASPPRACDETGAGDIYRDTSLALCFCDATSWQVLNPLTVGVGTCS